MSKKNIFLTSGARFLAMVMGMVSTIIVARYLNPDGLGGYRIAVAFAMLASQFANLGLQSSNTYYVARDRALFSGLLANSLWMALLVGGGGTVAAALFMQATGRLVIERPIELWLATSYVAPMLFLMLASNLLVGTNRIIAYNIYELLYATWNLALNVGASVLLLGVPGVLWASVLGNWVPAALLLWWICKHPVTTDDAHGAAPLPISLRPRFDLVRTGFLFGFKAYLATLFGALVGRSLLFTLQHAAGDAEVGYYSVAAQIADVLYILPASAALILFPDLVRNATGRWAATMRALLVIGGMMVVACLLSLILVKPFLLLVLPKYVPAVSILWYLLPGTIFLGLATVISQFLAASGFPRSVPVVWMAAWGLVTILSQWLVPLYNGRGAALALSLTYGFLLMALTIVAVITERRHAAAGAAETQIVEPAIAASTT